MDMPVKPYRTPPFSNIQSSATQKCFGVIFFSFFCIVIFTILFFSFEKSVILRVKYFIPYFASTEYVVAKWIFAVWFQAWTCTVGDQGSTGQDHQHTGSFSPIVLLVTAQAWRNWAFKNPGAHQYHLKITFTDPTNRCKVLQVILKSKSELWLWNSSMEVLVILVHISAWPMWSA